MDIRVLLGLLITGQPIEVVMVGLGIIALVGGLPFATLLTLVLGEQNSTWMQALPGRVAAAFLLKRGRELRNLG